MKRRSILLTLVMVLPALLGLTTLVATSDSVDNIDAIPAAIVNLDEPVTLDSGDTLPAGRQMLASLTAPDQTTLDWSVVSADTAESGLAEGTYYAVVTIPSTFSRQVADVLQGDSTTVPQVEVSSSSSSPVVGSLTSALVTSAANDLGTTLTVSYLDTSLAATTTISDSIGDAARGAQDLHEGQESAAEGASTLADGAASLTTGLESLHSGTSELSSGADTLADGVGTYTDAVSSAASGASTLASGASSLSSGVAAYTGGVAQVYSGITKAQSGSSTSLKDGAATVAAGIDTLNTTLASVDVSGLATMPNQLGSAADAANTISDTAGTQLTQAIAACQFQTAQLTAAGLTSVPSDQTDYCAAATQIATGIVSGASTLGNSLSEGADQATAAASQLSTLSEGQDALEQLSAGAHAVSDGISTLATSINSNLLGTNASTLTSGASQLATGATTLSEGLATLNASSSAVTSGASQLATGATSLDEGAASANDGADQLAEGAATLADGSAQLTEGASTLADGLSQAQDAIPTYTDDQASEMASAIATPVGVSDQGGDSSAMTAFASAAGVAGLWIGTLLAILCLGSINRRRIESAATPFALTVQSLWPAAVLSVIQALALWVTFILAGVEMSHAFAALLILLLASVALTAVQQALLTACGRRGGIAISLFLFVAQAVCLGIIFPSQTQGGFLAIINSTTPMPAAAGALQTLITGTGATVGNAIAVLLVWAAIAFVVELVAIKKRRQTSLGAVRTHINQLNRAA